MVWYEKDKIWVKRLWGE